MENKFSDHYTSTFRGAYTLKKGITPKEVEEIASDPYLKVIVITELSRSEFELLETSIFSKNPKVLLSKTSKLLPEPVDLGFLKHLPSLKKLRLCDATSLSKPNQVELMNGLDELSFYRFEPPLLEILAEIKPQLKTLYLENNLSKNCSLDCIDRFKDLSHLYIEGPCKGIEKIGNLSHLETLVLRSISTPNLDFLYNLQNLWSLDIKLGGIRDFSALTQLPHIKYLELWQVKGLSDVSFIEKMPGLQYLHLESLIQITDLPSFQNLNKLRRIELMNMKGLKQLDNLKNAPQLEDFFYTMIHQHQPEDLIPVLQNLTVKTIYVNFPSDKKNTAFKELAGTYGKSVLDNWPTFTFNS